MTALPPGQQLTAPGKWPTVGEREPAPWQPPWRVEVAGQVEQPASWTVEQLRAMPQVDAAVDIHCVTRWSKLGVAFRGVPLSQLLEETRVSEPARFVSFVAQSRREHTTSLPLADALELQTLIVLEVEGIPLQIERGGPVRVVVPGRYFYKSVKWLKRIDLLAEDRLGFWESSAGYHNTADPWRQQRYIAAGISRQEAAELIAARDFSGRDLLGIDAAGRDLSGLDARRALLRDADFRGSDLRAARFDEANLSNAHFQGADLRAAVFSRADIEGADFTDADLRGADLRVSSLLGATFFDRQSGEAKVDHKTRWNPASLAGLSSIQIEFLQRRGVSRAERGASRGDQVDH